MAHYMGKNKSLTEELKITLAEEVLIYRDSTDTKVSSASVVVRTGQKWHNKSRLQQSILVGSEATGWARLSNNPKPR